jgi:hypothetical protein
MTSPADHAWNLVRRCASPGGLLVRDILGVVVDDG